MNVFDPNAHIQTIVIVGCGGTGAQVARIVARIVYDMRRARLHTPGILLVDPDIVEEKNVGRQLFTAADAALKLPKAEVVGKRLNMALGLDISWSVESFNAEKHGSRYGSQLVIGCVDNHLARRELHRAQGILIGAGNYRDGGQVVIGNVADPERMHRYIDGVDGKYAYLPKEGLLFPALLEPEAPPLDAQSDLSCAELVLRGEQDVLINDWMACVVGQYVSALLRRQPIRTFASFISLDGMSVRSLPICRDELEPYLLQPASD
ncbi:MAG: ThiF family adenylyltransferase [Anaerolineae bacterium]|jgi:PRTRC genetic system ThiF family protein|nr:ThiF family adenylyltransferase [Anaerolineae bacterium]